MVSIKKIIALLLAAVMLAAFAVTLSADPAAEQRVFDNAGLFTEDEILNIDNAIDDFINKTGMDCVVLTINDAEGKDSRDVADDFYDYGGFGIGDDASGMLFLIDMDNREVYVSTTGEAIDYIYDSRKDSLLDIAFDNVSHGRYGEAGVAVVNRACSYILTGVKGSGRVEENAPPPLFKWILVAVVSLAVASIAGGIACAGVKGKYKMVTGGYKYNYRENFKGTISRAADNFINQTVTSHSLESSSSSSGGHSSGGHSSSVHHSSSGTSHGGGGRRF